jgi:hypothetical protein
MHSWSEPLLVLPAALFMLLMPLQSSAASASGAWRDIGGWGDFWTFSASLSECLPSPRVTRCRFGARLETLATTLLVLLFLIFLSLGLWNIRRWRIARHREWMIRAFDVILGTATKRPSSARSLRSEDSRRMNFSASRSGWDSR